MPATMPADRLPEPHKTALQRPEPVFRTVQALGAAREQGENLMLVLGHADYYPRFGFTPASGHGIHPPFDVPDENMMALALDPAHPVPAGIIRYPAPFGV